jgi:hypothetical protein
MDPDLRNSVLSRDFYQCQAHPRGFALERPCQGQLVIHHRELVTKRDEEDNLLTLCDGHHKHAHDRERAEAERCGIIVRRNR